MTRAGSSVLDPAPPRTGGDDGGGGGGWAWLVTARGIIEAELVRGALEASGIVPVALDARDPSPGAWLFLSGNVNALVRVFVPRSLLDAARLVLLEAGWEADPAPEQQPAPPGHTWKWWVWAVLAVVLVALFLVATVRGSVT